MYGKKTTLSMIKVILEVGPCSLLYFLVDLRVSSQDILVHHVQVDTLVYATGFDLLASGYGFEITNKLGRPAREEFGAAPQGQCCSVAPLLYIIVL